MYAQRADVGAVGAKLYYPDKTTSRFPIVALRPLSGIVQAPGGGFIVEQLREGGEDVQEPHPAQLQAEVHIVQGHRDLF